MVPKDVQDAILLKYIEICDQIYSLAFFQWRIANPSKIKNEDEELKEGVYDKSIRLLITKSLDDPYIENETRTSQSFDL